jgi:hypothetical protein
MLQNTIKNMLATSKNALLLYWVLPLFFFATTGILAPNHFVCTTFATSQSSNHVEGECDTRNIASRLPSLTSFHPFD